MTTPKDIGFYHLTSLPLDKALPRLLDKVYQAGHRVVVVLGSNERVENFDQILWTFTPLSFVPHGSVRDDNPMDHPVWLSTSCDNVNNATVLVVADGVDVPDLDTYDRCLVLFNGEDVEALSQSRATWRRLKDAGHALTYWQQDAAGGWSKK